jgi:cell wall-associated NlpC family hydrolase
MYSKPIAHADVISQAIYNTGITVIKEQNGFALIQTPDNYQGWVDKRLLSSRTARSNASTAKVTNFFANIYQEPNTMKHEPIVTAAFATEFPIVKDVDERWLKVSLADGNAGFIQKGDVAINAEPLTMSEMLKLSHKFIGLPYLWGGVSTYGFDCSGFVEMLYAQMGIILPRDNNDQVYLPGYIEVAKQNLQPGDIMYFGWDNVISHAAVYLGDNKFIGSTAYKNPSVQICDLRNPYWNKIFIVARRMNNTPPPQFKGSIATIPHNIKQQMLQYTWHQGCPVPIENLAYLQISYWGFDNKPHQGELIVNQNVARDVLAIFKELYEEKFPIEKMRLIDDYQGNDQASMADNNTTSFNCRTQTDFGKLFSMHSYGMAIDINPLINPYVNNGKIEPKEGAANLERDVYHKGKIIKDSAVYNAFAKRGWIWGGDSFGAIHDYQHFEKPLNAK